MRRSPISFAGTFALASALFGPVSLGADARKVEAGARLLEAQRYREALDTLQGAVQADPANARAAALYGRAFLEENDVGRAVEWLEKASLLDSSSSSTAYWLGRAYGEQAIHGNVVVRAKLAGKIKRAFERAVELDPDNMDARIGLVEFYLQAPSFMGGSFEKARQQTDELRRRDPLHGYLAKARLEEHRKRRDLAEAQYEAAMRDFPGRPEPYYWRERGAIGRKDWPSALEAMDRLLRQRPEDAEPLYEIGRIAALSGRDLDRGEASLRHYLEHAPRGDEPSLAEAHMRMAEIEERRGTRAAARSEYAAALELDPGIAGARQALAKLR
ncbi:MAG: tetratricopeptide repeat protein [Acidobacteriota bacterium]